MSKKSKQNVNEAALIEALWHTIEEQMVNFKEDQLTPESRAQLLDNMAASEEAFGILTHARLQTP